MKIDGSYKPAPGSLAPKAPAPKPAATASPAESVSLSQASGVLGGSEKPPVNMARVQEIKQAISEGRFKINPEAIAERLIESARELVSSGAKREA